MPSNAAIAWADSPSALNSSTCSSTVFVAFDDIATVSCGAAPLAFGRDLFSAAATPAATGCTCVTAVTAANAPLVGLEDAIVNHPVLYRRFRTNTLVIAVRAKTLKAALIRHSPPAPAEPSASPTPLEPRHLSCAPLSFQIDGWRTNTIP